VHKEDRMMIVQRDVDHKMPLLPTFHSPFNNVFSFTFFIYARYIYVCSIIE
jgi:hypothetical protein